MKKLLVMFILLIIFSSCGSSTSRILSNYDVIVSKVPVIEFYVKGKVAFTRQEKFNSIPSAKPPFPEAGGIQFRVFGGQLIGAYYVIYSIKDETAQKAAYSDLRRIKRMQNDLLTHKALAINSKDESAVYYYSINHSVRQSGYDFYHVLRIHKYTKSNWIGVDDLLVMRNNVECEITAAVKATSLNGARKKLHDISGINNLIEKTIQIQ